MYKLSCRNLLFDISYIHIYACIYIAYILGQHNREYEIKLNLMALLAYFYGNITECQVQNIFLDLLRIYQKLNQEKGTTVREKIFRDFSPNFILL